MDSPDETSDNDESVENLWDNRSITDNHNDVIVVNAPSSNSDTDDEQIEGGPVRRYDTNLPTLHKYLGGLNSVSGYCMYEDGQHLTLIAIHTNTIVSPGFMLPLVLYIPIEQEIMKKCINEGNVFAVVFETERRGHIFACGIIMQVFESFLKQGTLYLKARGRQRCKIVPSQEIRSLGGRLIQITVIALVEPDIKSPITCTQLSRLKAVRDCCFKDYDKTEAHCKFRQYHLAQFPYPSWIYDHNEVSYYCKLVTDLLEKYYLKEYIPVDPVSVSFWFLQNFQLMDGERLEILKKNSVIERLKLEYKYLLKDRTICCRVCQQNIAQHNDVFPMSKDGVQSAYCNPEGHVYETLTTTQIQNYTLLGLPTKEFSWFPGYEWTIVQCQTCRGHLGWRFISKHLQPSVFFGLARTSLDIKILNSTVEVDNI